MRAPGLLPFVAVLLAFLPASPSAEGPAPPPATQPHALSEALGTYEASAKTRIYLDRTNALSLEVQREEGETLEDIARRMMQDPTRWEMLRPLQPAPPAEKAKAYARIPYEELKDSYKYLTIARLFPEDSLRGEFWIHPVGRSRIPVAAESLWHLALWLTGDGRNFEALAKLNGLRDLTPVSGRTIRIPRTLLSSVFAAPIPTAEGELTFGTDEQGEYAAYSLKKGQAIYSSVVIRFTGLLEADEVNEMATIVARRTGIEDVRSLAVGYRVKIPREYVLPEFLPPGDLRRIEYELNRREVAQFRNAAVSRHLEGVTVILDAGHGGRDIGAARNGVWESDYVYDILCRIKLKLEKETAAQVLTTLKDSQHAFRVFQSRRIPLNQSEVVLTTPPFRLSSSAPSGVGVNLRWYLANSYLRSLRKKGVEQDKVVFASIHADSLHPTVRGTMIYVPGQQYRKGTYGFSGPHYRRRKEVKEQVYVSFTREQRLKAEGLSREFASHVLKSLRNRGVRIHPYQPVRDRVIRKRRPWVPAVLRCNLATVQILLEACNINNPEDAKLLTDPAYRQLVADAFVDALLGYYA